MNYFACPSDADYKITLIKDRNYNNCHVLFPMISLSLDLNLAGKQLNRDLPSKYQFKCLF